MATDGLLLEGIGAISRGMGGTSSAHYVGPASMMGNPATMGLSEAKSQFLFGTDIVTRDVDAVNLNTGEHVSTENYSNNRGPYVAPQFAYTTKISKWTFGAGLFAQAGLGTEYGNTSFLSRGDIAGVGHAEGAETGLDNKSRLFILDIPFAASYDLNDRFSVGASVDAKWTGLNLDYLVGGNQLNSLVGSGRASGSLLGLVGTLPDPRGVHIGVSKDKIIASGFEGWGYSGRLGLLYKLSPVTKVGMSYMFESNMNDLKGDATVTAVDGVLGNVPIQGKIRLIDFNTPAKLDIGISHQVTDKLLIAMDVSRVFWEDALKDIRVGFSSASGSVDLAIPQDAKDQTIVAIGASYAATQKLTLRAGYRQATQPFNDDTLLALVPGIIEKHASLGFSYQLSEAGRIDAAYSHAFENSLTNRTSFNTSVPVESTLEQDNFVLSYTYSW
jgi:long-chain fatty acid transport protein